MSNIYRVWFCIETGPIPIRGSVYVDGFTQEHAERKVKETPPHILIDACAVSISCTSLQPRECDLERGVPYLHTLESRHRRP